MTSTSNVVKKNIAVHYCKGAAGTNLNLVCRVGYALNAKKMRKSHASPSNKSNEKLWSGGGLADILTDEVEEGVSFEPFDFDHSYDEQATLFPYLFYSYHSYSQYLMLSFTKLQKIFGMMTKSRD